MSTQNLTQPEEPGAIEDLTVSESETAEVKGGGRYLLELKEVKGESQ